MTETNDTILEIACRHAHECGLISADRVEFLDSVRAACAVNYCGQYGTRWTCPPGVGTVAEWRDKCLVYRTALVFSTKHELEDPYDFEGMAAASKAHSAIECALLDELGFEDRLVLGAGACDLCEKCTYPSAPCRFPSRAQPTVEACGISVVDLAKACGMRYNNGENTVTYFSVVFFDRRNVR